MEYIEALRPIMQEAGRLVLSSFRGSLTIAYKNDRSICTDIDLMCEDFLKNQLCILIPGSGFIAEETDQSEIREYTWIIDPIDGTKNFARGLPYFAINVALMHNFEVIAAMTYMPAMSDLVYAQKGFGSWRSGQQLIIGDRGYQEIGALVVISDFRLRQTEQVENIKQGLKHLDQGVRFRVGGAAAVDLAYVAAGSYDLALFENLKWWDSAAGTLLISEAGGWVSAYDGSGITSFSKSLIAGNLTLCQLILPYL